MKIYGVIYKTTNLINGKIYVGKTTKPTEYNYFGSGKIISWAIDKYGLSNFTREILEECSTNKKLNIREIFWIKKLNSTDHSIGYNISKGGTGGDTYSNNPNKQKIIEKLKNKIAVKDANGNTFQINANDPRYVNGELVGVRYGSIHSRTTLKKMKGYIMCKHKITGDVIRLHSGSKEWLSGNYVGVKTGIKQTNIKVPYIEISTGKQVNLAINDKRRLLPLFVSINKGKTKSIESRKKMSLASRKNITSKQVNEVIQLRSTLNSKNLPMSIKQISERTGISQYTISSILKRKTYSNLITTNL